MTNQKGGVGKTTTAINTACALAGAGERVLLIDMDPQGNASTGLDVGLDAREPGVYEVLSQEAGIAASARATAFPNLSIVPSIADLAGIDMELASASRREYRLRDAIARIEPKDAYSVVLLDCPPSLGLLTLNALVAADAVLIPLQCEFFALEGLSQLMRTVEAVRHGLNPALVVDGIVLTMTDRRNNLSEQVAAEARAHFGPLVWRTSIPRNIRVSEAPSHGKPVLSYDPKSAGALAYVALAAEFLERRSGVNA